MVQEIKKQQTKLLSLFDLSSTKIINLTYIVIGIHFFLNFIGSPLIKHFYLFEVTLFLLLALTRSWDKITIPIFAFFFIEGQGRVLWEYHPLFRNIFDITLIVAVIKNISIKKKLYPNHLIPSFLTMCIIGHTLWYFVQIFNTYAASSFGVIAASKIYLFPFLLFFMFLQNPVRADNGNLYRLQKFIILLIFVEAILCIYQRQMGEEFIYSMNQFYKTRTQGIFINDIYRPFGTSHFPGAFSVYIALSVGFFFITPTPSLLLKIIKPITILLSWVALFMMQVRTATIRHILLILGINFILLFPKNKTDVKSLFKIVPIIAGIILFFANISYIEKYFPDLDLSTSVDRFESISDFSQMRSKRISVNRFASVLINRIADRPMGLGPGRTGAATSVTMDEIKNDPVYDMTASWSHDNLFISLAIDFGLGMIFYSLVVILFPLLLMFYAFRAFIAQEREVFRILVTSGFTALIVLFANWGAVGIPYNPESFIYWFFIAQGISHYNKGKFRAAN